MRKASGVPNSEGPVPGKGGHVAQKRQIDEDNGSMHKGQADDVLQDDGVEGGTDGAQEDSDFGIMGSHLLYVKVWRPLRGQDFVCRSAPHRACVACETPKGERFTAAIVA
jgi:hypothetical protein